MGVHDADYAVYLWALMEQLDEKLDAMAGIRGAAAPGHCLQGTGDARLKEKTMSGQPGSALESKYYRVEYKSGLSISPAPPPHSKNADKYVSGYFKDRSKPYERKLRAAEPQLNEYFERLAVSEEMPVVEIGRNGEWIYGVIIEDVDERKRDGHDEKHGKNWLSNSKRPALVSRSVFLESSGNILELTLAINRQILRSQLNEIETEIAGIFE